MWRANDPQGNESGKVKYDIVRWIRGTGLDLGCGLEKVWPHVIGVDNGHHWGQGAAEIKVDDATNLKLFGDEAMDFVYSSHLLEHVVDPAAALKEWWRVLKVGGCLVLHVPHKDLYPRCGEYGANPDHKNDFDNADVIALMKEVAPDWRMRVDEVRDRDNGEGQAGNEYSLLQVYQKLEDGKGHNTEFAHLKHGRTCTVVRYGGMGDNMQASSVLKELKDQGYYITYVTNPLGFTVLQHNPYIDEFFLQDNGQIPDTELHNVWEVMERNCDKFVNLCESVEGTLLTIPMRISHGWPESVRRKYLNLNYIEWSHELAEVPFTESHVEFHPTNEEALAADEYALNKMGGFNIMMAVAGSAIHKIYLYQDEVIRRVLNEMPEAQFILTGSESDAKLEDGWENNDRVHCSAGKMALRDSLTLAQVVNCVVGPETGILNSVSMNKDVHKVIYLSHSSNENLTRDWVNTTALIPDAELAPCHPCHKLHYGKGACPIHEASGTPICVAAIDPDKVIDGIRVAYESWKDSRDIQAGNG